METSDDKRDKYLTRWAALKTERADWDSHWAEIAEYLLPRSPRFLASDRNRGDKRHNNIYDGTAGRALIVLGAGMISGASSPARPWFRLSTQDTDLNDFDPVKLWLHRVTELMQTIFSRSNTYRALHTLYRQEGAFGTGASIMVHDFDTVVHHYPLSIGEYALATDYRGQVDTIYREFEKTVAEVVREFGIGQVSRTVSNLYQRGMLDSPVTLIHAVEPRAVRDLNSRSAKQMPWASVYFEKGADKGQYLRESGFERFPALCPRWITDSGDIYGSSPAMDVLGDIKQLQHQQMRKAQGIDYQTKPPLQAPGSMRGQPINALPGGMNYLDTPGASAGIRSAWESALDLSHLLADINDVRQRIQQGFFTDLFLMLANQTDTRMTATEVAERHEEKLLMLGPVLERQDTDLFEPLIEMTFDYIIKSNILPPPPEEIQGVDLDIEFVSMLAQAQRVVATNGVDRFVGNLGQIAQYKPDVLDKFDSDEWADAYADMLGVQPQMIVASDKVALIRKARAEQQAAAAQAEQQAQAASTARDLASADTSGQNALTDAAKMFSGYSA